MNCSQVKSKISQNWHDFVIPKLSEYIRIPNKSPLFDADWEKHGYMQEAAELLLTATSKYEVALNKAIVKLEKRTPTIVLDVPATGGASGNVLIYGHYDKQPEFSGWRDGLEPWKPVLREGRLYGRGGADDGYAIFGALSALESLQAQDIPHPRCLILIEGCEESGSFDLPHYIEELGDRIGEPDLVICLDAECGNYEQLWLTTSLRGVLSGTLNCNVLTEGVHSGAAGGYVPSSFRVMRHLLSRIEDPSTGTLHDCLKSTQPDFVAKQSKLFADTLGEEVLERFPWHGATSSGTESLADLVTMNSWGPSMEVVGLAGAPAPEDAGNTLRPYTSAKLVFRVPPNVDAQDAGAQLKQILEAKPPHVASVSFEINAAENGWYAKPIQPWLQKTLDDASRSYFSKPMRSMGCGGTIPFMGMLGERFPDCQFVVTGVLGPHSNAHGPNEFLDIQTGINVSCVVASVLADAAHH